MTTPRHYQFPNGAQPLDLSRYLTSNGGQALQYIARSCRLDEEQNKHDDAADDLIKAIHFLYDEIKRVGNERDLERVRKVFQVKKEEPKIPVYFEGGQSVEYRMGEPTRVCLGTAHINEIPADPEWWQPLNGLEWPPATEAPKVRAYLTFEKH